MAPSVFDKDRVMPIGKPGVRVKDDKKRWLVWLMSVNPHAAG
jgi:hypothetical protein